MNRKNMTKKKQRDEETIRIPEALEKVTLPRNIDLQSFFDARMMELDHFLSILNQKAAVGGKMGNKKNFQLLPKHMRRRAMSHNSHRVPSRIRHMTQSAAQLKNPCKKTRKNTQKLIEDYQARTHNTTWLETHIWHAKRMKMKKLWGYKLALHSNDKGIRAAYRFMKNSSILYDSSYFAGVIVYDVEFIRTCLQTMPKENFSVETFFFCGTTLVCPVEVFNAENAVVLIVHPAAYLTVVKVLEDAGIAIVKIKDQLTVFRLRGAKSTEVLSKVLNIEDSVVKDLVESASLFHNLKFPDGAILSVQIEKKIVKMKESARNQTVGLDMMVPLQPSPDLLKVLCQWPVTFYNSYFWSGFTEIPIVSHSPQTLTTRSARSRYPSCKKISTENKAKTIKETTIDIKENAMEIDETPKSTEKIEALLVYRKEKFGDGWDIILKNPENNWLWRSLVYAGAKAVGLKEYSSIFFEQGKRFFPNDYPTTEAYIERALALAEEKLTYYFKRPSSKRMNYERIASPFPFFSNWTIDGSQLTHKELLPVQIKCYNRCPQPLAYICMAEASDLNSSKIHYKEPLQDRKKPNSQIGANDLENWKDIKTSRNIIGFVTSGGFSFSRSKGFGLGCIFRNFADLTGKKVLFRNPSSQFYHVCSLGLI